MGAEGRQQQRGDAGDRDQRRRRHLVAVRAQHGDAGDVLRGHGHHEQRDADADHRGQGEFRRGPDRLGQGELEAAEVQQAKRRRRHAAHQQRHQHGIARLQALEQQVAEEHRQHQGGAMLGGEEDLAADLEQDAGQQGRRERAGQPAHQPLEAAGQADQGEQDGADDEGADRLAVAHPRQAGDQQRGAWRRPGHYYGRAIAQRQADGGDGHADGQGPDP
ncbi:hypothetical protein D9M70_379630 [compost metagenome]